MRFFIPSFLAKKRNLDLSDVAGATHDRMNVLLTDVVVVAHRWGHLGRALSQPLLFLSIGKLSCQIIQDMLKVLKLGEGVPKKAAVLLHFVQIC